MKDKILFLFWFPTLVRCIWRKATGRYFVFRDEPVEFIRFVQYLFIDYEKTTGDSLNELYDQLQDEIAARRRRGTM